MSITLDHLRRMTQGRRGERVVNVTALSRAMGKDHTALEKRLSRGAPELTAEEQEQLRNIFWILGLAVREDLPGLPAKRLKQSG